VVVLWSHEWRVTGPNFDGHKVGFIFDNFSLEWRWKDKGKTRM